MLRKPKVFLTIKAKDKIFKIKRIKEEITETKDITEGGKKGEQKRKVNRVKKMVGPTIRQSFTY